MKRFVIFADRLTFSQSDARISVAYNICRRKSPSPHVSGVSGLDTLRVSIFLKTNIAQMKAKIIQFNPIKMKEEFIESANCAPALSPPRIVIV